MRGLTASGAMSGRGTVVGAAVALVALVAGGMALGWAPAAEAATPSYAVTATIPLGFAGNDVAVDPVTHTAYVVNTNADSVTAVDTTTNTVEATIPVGILPFAVAVDPGTHRAYVSNSGDITWPGPVSTDRTVSVIDTTTNTVTDTLQVFPGPRGVAVDPATHAVYVATYIDNQMAVRVDPTTSPATISTSDTLGSRPWAAAIDPRTHLAYISTLFGGTVSVLDGTTILDTIGGFSGPVRIAIQPSTSTTAGHAYVVNNGKVSIIDTATETLSAATLPTGNGPASIAVDTTTDRAYIPNQSDNTVSVVDLSDNTLVATVAVGSQPTGVAVDPNTHDVYVLNGDGTMSVISLPSQQIGFTSTAPTNAAVGGTYTAAATGGASGNAVTFSTVSAACSVEPDGHVAFVHAGTCVIAADQAGNDQYAPAPQQELTVAVAPAATHTALRVLPRTLVATVAPSNAGPSAPEGTVTFAVDGQPVATAALSNGVARAAYTVAPGKTRAVSATYSGSTDFLSSSASTARHDPAVTARPHSAARITRYGWYRNPVTVTFSCTTHGAPLVGNCPSPVRLSRNGAAQSVTRTVHATDGGAATVTVSGISVDTIAPRVTISGPRAGVVYAGTAPRAACVAHDKLSGVASCILHTTALPAPNGETLRYRAAAIDKAGNRAVSRGSYRVVSNYLAGAPFRNGAFNVRQGTTYTLLVRTATNRAPRFYDAVPAGQQPTTPGDRMHRAGTSGGMRVWELPVRIDTGLDRYPIWNLGVRTTDSMHVVRFRIAH